MSDSKVKVCVAMSGGVDSTAAAKLLIDRGFDVGGAIMQLFDNFADIKDAQGVSELLGIRLDVIDCREEFKRFVIDDFISSYIGGSTPNPCVVCNKHVKLGAFLDNVLQLGYDKLATGHYARTEQSCGRVLLKKGADEKKDQSYVLYSLSQFQLSHIIFPLGEMSKDDIRMIARDTGFFNADRPDSQDICFIKDGNYASFIKRQTGKSQPCGDMLLSDGSKIGTHKGLEHYTIGQRKGLGVSYSKPLFVIKKDIAQNCVVLGTSDELFSSRLTARDVNYIPFDTLTSPIKITARTRYHQKASPATLSPLENGRAEVVFDTPQRAICPGQSVVFYDNEYVVGGGIIE